MKRITALLLSLLTAFSLTACGDDELTDAVIDTVADAVIDSLEDSSASASSSGDKSLLPPEVTDDYVSTVIPDDGDYAATSDQSLENEEVFTVPVEEGEYYYDLESVVLYLEYYGELPENYITKKEARSMGWEGGSVERYIDDAAIGGDYFGNKEGLLPAGKYTECDLDTLDENSRGAERLVFTDDGQYYYTDDHYDSFTQVWVENGEVIWE